MEDTYVKISRYSPLVGPKHLFTREDTERNNDRIKMENLYYPAIYDMLQEPDQHKSKTFAMRRHKAKIIV